VKDHLIWLDETVPVREDQILSAFWTAAIPADIGMVEVGIRDQPSSVIKGEFYR
jgi:hypothetical protein